jgi:hypothetical protein
MKHIYILFLLIALISVGCTTSSEVIDMRPTPDDTVTADSTLDDEDYVVMDYAAIRSNLRDPLGSVQNPYPDEFKKTGPTFQAVSRQGYRVQLLSTQNRESAEIILEEYKIWVAQQRPDYEAQAYIIFRAPNYRVHVGDFHIRNEAVDFSRLLKDSFPDAWVVADIINTDLIPRN